MKIKVLIVTLLWFLTIFATACGDGKTGSEADEALAKYIDFRTVNGFYDGKEYSVNLPYLIDDLGTADIRSAIESIDRFANLIIESTMESGYMVEASCVLIEDDLISIRLTEKYDSRLGNNQNVGNLSEGQGGGEQGKYSGVSDKNESIWAVNYSIADNMTNYMATTDFPHSENYRAQLQSYLNEYYKAADNGNVRIYNFDVPFIYYADNSKLIAAATFTKLSDGGIIQSSFAEADITQGPNLYFTKEELANISDIIYNGYDGLDVLPVWGSAGDINDEYAIVVTYFDDNANKFESHIFALNQPTPVFPKVFDALTLKISYEDNQMSSGDHTKVYTFIIPPQYMGTAWSGPPMM